MHIKALALAFSLSTLISSTVRAQIQVGSKEIPVGNSSGSLDKEDMETFKKTTTIFTLRVDDVPRKADFEKAISSVWKITPFKVVAPNEISQYTGKKNYSVFYFGGFVIQRTSSTMQVTNTHLAYELRLPQFKKNGDYKDDILLARFLLMPDAATLRMTMTPINTFGRRKQAASITNHLYTKATFSNWGPGFVKGYLKTINDLLTERDTRGPFSETTNREAMAKMATDTLYLPSYLSNSFNAMTGKEKDNAEGTEQDDNVTDAYPYPVKYVSFEVLDDMILNRNTPFYYLLYTRSSTDKYVTVFEGLSGAMLYANYTAMSYNFKNKDLRKVAKAVR